MSRSSLGNVTVPDLAGGENLTMNDRALVLLSGGQDSTVCLAWALDRFAHVETIGFDYGQKHRVELDVRPNVLAAIRRGFPAWAEKLGEDHLIDLTVLGRMSDTALTRDVAIRFEANGLPNKALSRSWRLRPRRLWRVCEWPALRRCASDRDAIHCAAIAGLAQGRSPM